MIHDHKKYGLLTVADILANSSDVGAIKIALRLGSPKFYDYIRGFGFGEPTAGGPPLGQPAGALSSYSIASISMGQEVGVTPLQMDYGGFVHRQRRPALQAARGEEMRSARRRTLPLEGPSSLAKPKRVVRPETAAMLDGRRDTARDWTESAAGRLDGCWKNGATEDRSIDGKIFADESPSRPYWICSINNPAVTILVSIDSPGGYPTWRRRGSRTGIQENCGTSAALIWMCRNVPVKSAVSSDRISKEKRDRRWVSMTCRKLILMRNPKRLKNPPIPDLAKAPKSPEVVMAADEGGDIVVPDFSGKTRR